MINILIVDDHPIVRQGLRQTFEETSDVKVAGEASEGNEVFEKLQQQNYDVILLDISMPGRGGIDVLKQLKALHPKLPVLILSMHSEDQYAIRAIKAGASGYMTKDTPPDQLVDAIRKVADGRKYISDFLAEKLAGELNRGHGGALHESLSDREFEVVRMIVEGKSLSQMAEEMSLSVKTISTYRTRALDKMGMKSNAELIHYSIENKITV